jgi:hypothetical protein
MSNQNLKQAAELLRRKGRGNDTILAHINPKEARILKAMGGSGLINPHTGLPEFCGCGGGGGGGGGGESTSSYSYSYSPPAATTESTNYSPPAASEAKTDGGYGQAQVATQQADSGKTDSPSVGGGLASLGPSVNTAEQAFGEKTADKTTDPTTGLASLGPSVNSPDAAFDNKDTAPLSANAQMQNILQNGFVKDASGNVVTDGSGIPMLSGDAAKLVSSGLAHWDNIIGSPTYHQWVGGQSANGTPGSVGKNGEWNYGTAVNGMTMDELRQLSENGQGSMMISDNQSVDNAIAAQNFDKVMTKYIGPVMVAAVPGGSFAVNIARTLGGLATGQTSFGDVASNLLVGLGANAIGISPGTATALLNMDWGKAVANESMKPLLSSIVQSISKSTGLPSSVVSYGLSQTGYAKDVSSTISDYVNNIIPGEPQNNVGAISNFIDGLLGTNTTTQAQKEGALPTFDVSGNYTYQPSGSSSTKAPLSTTGATTTPATAPTTTPTTAPAAAQSTSSTSSASPIPWLDTTESVLKNQPVNKKTLTPEEIKNLYGSMEPSLAQQMQNSLGISPTSGLPGYATGGDITTYCYNQDPKYMPKFIDDKSELLQGSGRHQPLGLQKLKQFKSQISPLGNMDGMASGGLPQKYHDAMPHGHKPEFVTGITGYYACGGGTGQSDDIPAMLHQGDYVMDADVVAALGDGSSKAGREILEGFRKQVPHKETTHGHPVPAKIADGEYVFPAGFVNALGGGDNKAGAKVLDGLREKLRAHKRSAPTSKIPPKAKSPLDYIKQVKG